MHPQMWGNPLSRRAAAGAQKICALHDGYFHHERQKQYQIVSFFHEKIQVVDMGATGHNLRSRPVGLLQVALTLQPPRSFVCSANLLACGGRFAPFVSLAQWSYEFNQTIFLYSSKNKMTLFLQQIIKTCYTNNI